LLSVQLVVGGLDAVQLGAWHSMARVLAHEMMNSLTPITSLTTSLAATARERQLSPEIATALETIAQRSENLMRFVERYRAIAEVPKPLVRPIDTQQFLQGVLLLLRDTAGGRQVKLEQAPKALPASFDADPELLEQALLNLLLNAIDAVADRPNGEVLLRASAEGQTFAFEVWDNGPGVPIGLLEDVFVPFFTTKHGGSGIGLSLARQIAIAHGGSLTGRHRPDGGMVFRMTVPNDLTR
jgi:two-component system, NtrC family, nitrogen regulation sensor histidine kinase NtrY